MKKPYLIGGLVVLMVGILFSFVYPIMAIVPNMVIDYPPSRVAPDGATFPEAKALYQYFVSDVDVDFNTSSDALWLGMWRDPNITIPDTYGIIGRLMNRDPDIQNGDFFDACFNVDIDTIPTGVPAYVKARWIGDADYPHTSGCDYRYPYGGRLDFLHIEIDKKYEIFMWAVDTMLDTQSVTNAKALPGVFWQFSIIGNPEDSGEKSGSVRTYYTTDFSFGISSGTYEVPDDGNGANGGANGDDTPPVSEEPTVAGPVFIGPILIAFGALGILHGSEIIEFKTFHLKLAVYIIIWLLAFIFAFFVANNNTFFWEWM